MFPAVISQVDAEHPNRQLIEHAHFECADGLYTVHRQSGGDCRLRWSSTEGGLVMMMELWKRCKRCKRCIQLLLMN